MAEVNCPICRTKARIQEEYSTYRVRCDTCGSFTISRGLSEYFWQPGFASL